MYEQEGEADRQGNLDFFLYIYCGVRWVEQHLDICFLQKIVEMFLKMGGGMWVF